MDRTTKALLAAIALGLWMNLAAEWLRPVPVQAQRRDPDLELLLMHVSSIANGVCVNKKIC